MPHRRTIRITRTPRPASRLLALAVGVSLATAALPASAAPGALPALTVPASAERHPGKLVLGELVTPDLAAAKRFYGRLFGWTFQDAPTGTFAQAFLGGSTVAAIVQRPVPPGRQPAWLGFLATADLDRTVAAAAAGGARVLFQPHPIANLGRGAVLADPQGAVFALLASGSGDPPDLLAPPGAWIWSSLVTSDPNADASFYKAALGYDVYPLPEPQDAQHMILASDDFARASVNPIPPAWTGARPRWISYVRVDDAAAAAARASTLGGRVVLPPRIDRHGGKIAVVADPQGALFGLMEWQQDQPAGSAK